VQSRRLCKPDGRLNSAGRSFIMVRRSRRPFSLGKPGRGAGMRIALDKDKKVRVAILGLGKMGILHTALVNMIPEGRLAALYDIDKKLARYVENAGLNVPFYSDLNKLLSEVELDAVFLCGPTYTNPLLARECAGRGLDMFAEKPLAHSFEAAKEMAALAAGRKLVNATGYLLSHWCLCQRAKKILEEGALGKVFRYRASIYISEVFSRKKGWFYSREKSGGGAVHHIASHLISLLYLYFGPARSVFGRTQSVYSEVEDSGTALFEYADGVQGTLDVSWSIPGYRLAYMNLTVEAENGSLDLTNDDLRMYLNKPAKGYPKEWTHLYRADMPSVSGFDLGGEGFYEEDRDFIVACLERRKPVVSWLEGLEVQRIIEAIYRSAASGKTVVLKEVV
jgi:predicted dehydrogenase